MRLFAKILLLVLASSAAFSTYGQRAASIADITGWEYERGQDRFTLYFANGAGFALEASTNFVEWGVLSDNVGRSFTDAEAGESPWRFYRLKKDGAVSENVVGYVRVEAGPGKLVFLFDPFLGVAKTPIAAEVWAAPLGTVTEGAELSLWNAESQKLQAHLNEMGKWNPPLPEKEGSQGFSLRSGEGPQTIIFSGEVPQGEIRHSYEGIRSLTGSRIPKRAGPPEALGLPNIAGTQISVFDEAAQGFETSVFVFGEWDPAPLILLPGRAFWLQMPRAAEWTQTFTIRP